MANEAFLATQEANWKRRRMSAVLVICIAAFGIWRAWQMRAVRPGFWGWTAFYLALVLWASWRAWRAYTQWQADKDAV